MDNDRELPQERKSWIEGKSTIVPEDPPGQAGKKSRAEMAQFPIRIDAGDFREITPAAQIALIAWAEHYGLDAWAGHVVYYFGKPYVTADGYLWRAKTQPTFRGITTSWASAEVIKALRLLDIDYVWEACVYDDRFREPIKAYGAVTAGEIHAARESLKGKAETLPIVRKPWGIAEKRAIRSALKLAYPIGEDTPVPGEAT